MFIRKIHILNQKKEATIKMDSIWTKSSSRPTFESLKGNHKTDVLIIGGGISGILCSYMLKQAGVTHILVEADKICSGITKNTTAKITIQHGLIYDKMIKRFGSGAAKMYLNAQLDAMKEYQELCKDIDCDYTKADSYVYSLDDKSKLEKEVKALNTLGCKAEFTDKVLLPFEVAGAVKLENQAQFHPLKFLFSIARDLPIYENTKVTELRPGCAVTNSGVIHAKKIIVATHFPFINKHGAYFIKMYQHRSYVIALENAPSVNGMYVDEAQNGMSFRTHNDLLLIGGGDHRTGKKGGGWAELEDFARRYYSDAREVARWATQDCMTLDSLPYIGRYSKHTPDLYVATGFNKWGMTSAMVAARLLCDAVQGKINENAPVFSPSRSILRPQLAANIAESLLGLITPTVPRCPHLGCALKYNKQEHSWDCSCHGSRFTEKGELIDGPATDDKRL